MKKFLLASTALALCMGTGGVAQAQPAGDQSAGSVEVVTVTAQKRVENVQDVPVAVTVVGEAQLARQNIVNISDLARAVPTLEVMNTPGQGGGPSVRGIGTQAVSLTSEDAVSIVVDGVVLGRAALSNLYDISRVEVLRGPQGMLFGKNASAGVLNISTNAPDPSGFDAMVHADVGDKFGYGVYQGMVNIPLMENAAIRLSGHINTEDGLYHNVTSGQSSNNVDWGVRGRFMWEPTEDLTINVIADFDRAQNHDEFLQWDYVDGSTPYAPPIFDPTRPVPSPTNPSYATLLQSLAACGVTPSRGNRNVCGNGIWANQSSNQGVSTQVDYRFDDYTITSITSYRQTHSDGQGDIDSTPVDFLYNRTKAQFNQILTQELRLTSPANQRLEYVAGFYYSDSWIGGAHAWNWGLGSVPLIDQWMPTGLYPFVPTGCEAFGGFITLCPLYVPNINSHGHAISTIASTAAFAQGTFKVTDDLRVIAGVRETFDMVYMNSLNLNTLVRQRGKAHVANFSYKLGLQYDLSSNLMAYATYTRGYKGPQVNLAATGIPATTVTPEIPVAFEVGVKGSVLDNRLNVDLNMFYTTVHDFQTQVIYNSPTVGPTFVIGNVPVVRTSGVELDVFGQPLPGLTVNGGAIWNPATYGAFCATDIEGVDGAGCPTGSAAKSVYGQQLAFTPKWKFNLSAEYAHELTDEVEGFVEADGVYKSKIDFLAVPDPLTNLNQTILLGARLGVRSSDGNWGISVFGRNLLDKRIPANLQVGPLSNFENELNGGVPSVAHVLNMDSFQFFGITLDKRF